MAKKNREQKLTPEEMSLRLRETEEELEAIRTGRVDALVISGPEGEKVYTLQGADHPYRVMVETMNEGAATLSDDGRILYCNRRLAEMLDIPLETLLGSALADWVVPQDRKLFKTLLSRGKRKSSKGEVELSRCDGSQMPALLSMSVLPLDERPGVCVVVTDLTDQKRYEELAAAQERLRQSEQELLASQRRIGEILESISDGFLALDRDWRFTYINRRAANNGGFEPAELIGENLWEKFPYLRGTELEKNYRRVMEERHPVSFEFASSNATRWYSTSIYPTADGLSLFWQEITERKRAESQREAAIEALRENESRLEAVLAAIPHVILEYNTDLKPVRANPAALKVAGLTSLDFTRDIAVTKLKFKNVDGSPIRTENLPTSRALRGEAVTDDLYLITIADGSERVISTYAVPLYKAGKISGVLALWNDITERTRAEEERERMARQVAAAEERQRLARELHDAVSQTLFAASTIADILPLVWERDPEEARRRLQELSRLNRGAFAEMRMLLLELRPNMLTQTPLPDLLSQLANAVTGRTRLALDVKLDGQSCPPPDVHLALYRIAQEALNNVVKHSQATQASLELRCDDYHATLQVTDNGQGFDPQGVSGPHLGLKIMRERAESIRADLNVDSQVGHGTVVQVIWTGKASSVSA